MENVYDAPSIDGSPLFGEIFFRIFVSSPSSHFPPLIPRINVLFLKKKEKKERTGGEARSFRKRDEIKVAFPDPFVPWKNIRVGARRCRKQTPNAYEIRMKYLYVCGKQLFTPPPLPARYAFT